MEKKNAEYWIERLDLSKHPEGGYYKETYRADLGSEFNGFAGRRNVSTGIYFLMTTGNFSAFHKIKSDEMWHFYSGDPITIYVLTRDIGLQTIRLGLDLDGGQVPQAVVPANCWFGSRVEGEGKYGLVGCTVAPGFDFEDFVMAERSELQDEFPDHHAIIAELTRL